MDVTQPRHQHWVLATAAFTRPVGIAAPTATFDASFLGARCSNSCEVWGWQSPAATVAALRIAEVAPLSVLAGAATPAW